VSGGAFAAGHAQNSLGAGVAARPAGRTPGAAHAAQGQIAPVSARVASATLKVAAIAAIAARTALTPSASRTPSASAGGRTGEPDQAAGSSTASGGSPGTPDAARATRAT
jgi:hypothetical protein